MTTATSVFMSGNSQAIRLPKAFRVNSKRVRLERIEGGFIVREEPQTMQAFLDALPHVPDWPDAPADGIDDSIKPW